MSEIVVEPPSGAPVPLIVSVAHAGRTLAPEMSGALRVSAAQLRQLEDPCVDRLFAPVPAHGGWLLVNRWARAVADVNRAPDEFAFAAPVPGWRASAKARIGLGVVPTRLGGSPIYRAPLTPAAVAERVALAHRPFHDALARLVCDVHARFGECFVLDAHSMPENAQPAIVPRSDAVLGDRWGAACRAAWRRAVETALTGEDLTVHRNRPYAGGYITRQYGRPDTGVHVLQLELRRGLYVDEASFSPLATFDTLAERLDRVVDAIVRYLRGREASTFALAGE